MEGNMLKEAKKNLSDLISIEHQIYTIYQKLPQSTGVELEKERQYLAMAEQLEKKYFTKNPIINPDKNYEQRVKYLSKEKGLQQIEIDAILTRIGSILFFEQNANPFLSTSQKAQSDNIKVISMQTIMDYFSSIKYYLEKAIEDAVDKEKREYFLSKKYGIEFQHPYLNSIEITPTAENKKRCRIFNQKEELIEQQYDEFATEIIRSSMTTALYYTNEMLEEEMEQWHQQLQIIILKSGIHLLSPEKRQEIASNVSASIDAINQVPILSEYKGKTLQDIENAIKESIQTEKVYTKKTTTTDTYPNQQ